METGLKKTKNSNAILKNYETIVMLLGIFIFMVLMVLIIIKN